MKRIAILGMGRSGTTFITEFLDRCGVFVDDVNWAHEHELARLVNDTALEREYGARPGLPYGELPRDEIVLSEGWRRLAQFFVDYMDLRARERGRDRWTFKDPRTTILHSIWLDHFDTIIGMYRAPQEVVASYTGQGWIKGMGRRRLALNYWRRFNQSLLRVYEENRSKKMVLMIDYNDDIHRQTTLLCERLGIQITPEARSLFQSELKHHSDGKLPSDAETRTLYDRLLKTKLD